VNAVLGSVRASPEEIVARRAGDDLVAADVVMDRGFTVAATATELWPWLVQLGKGRGGWYLPRSVERLVPGARRATRSIEPQWQALGRGDVIPDYGGRDATFTVAMIEPPWSLVYRSCRGSVALTWSISITELDSLSSQSRVHLRLRLGPVRRKWLAEAGGGLIDLLTIAGLAAGLRERLRDASR
jgi:hypothetical protein